MKVLVVGDPHFKIGNLESANRLCQTLLERQSEVDEVVILGDLNDTHSVIRSEVLAIWCKYFTKITKPHYLLVGNHDQAQAGSRVHGLEAFKSFQGVTVVDKPHVTSNAVYLPYLKDRDAFIASAEGSAIRGGILYCHQTFEGAVFENGWSPDQDAVPQSAVSHFKLVISGHIHKRQKVGNIYYVGTPFQHSFGDVGSEKGIHIIDTETLDAKFIPLPEFPIYRQIEGNADDCLSQVKSLTLRPHDYLKIVASDSKDRLDKLKKSKELDKVRKSANVILSLTNTDKAVGTKIVSDALTPANMLEEYVNLIMDTGLSKPEILRIAHECLRD